MKFNTFWNNFRDVVIRFSIDSSNADWYVKCAEQFAVSIKGRSLRQRTPKDIQFSLDWTRPVRVVVY